MQPVVAYRFPAAPFPAARLVPGARLASGTAALDRDGGEAGHGERHLDPFWINVNFFRRFMILCYLVPAAKLNISKQGAPGDDHDAG